jgi:hypothetical protein
MLTVSIPPGGDNPYGSGGIVTKILAYVSICDLFVGRLYSYIKLYGGDVGGGNVCVL